MRFLRALLRWWRSRQTLTWESTPVALIEKVIGKKAYRITQQGDARRKQLKKAGAA